MLETSVNSSLPLPLTRTNRYIDVVSWPFYYGEKSLVFISINKMSANDAYLLGTQKECDILVLLWLQSLFLSLLSPQFERTYLIAISHLSATLINSKQMLNWNILHNMYTHVHSYKLCINLLFRDNQIFEAFDK